MSSFRVRNFAESPCSGPKTAPHGWRPLVVGNIEKILAQYFKNSINDNQLVRALKNNGIKAVCFDMDGTLVDTEEANWTIIQEGCRNTAILSDSDIKSVQEVLESRKQEYIGTTIVGFLEKLFNGLHIHEAAVTAQTISDTKPQILRDLLTRGKINDFKKIIDLAKILQRGGFKVSLVTSSTKDSADAILEHFQIRRYFSPIITRDEVGDRRKEDPYPYNLAMQEFQVQPNQTLIFEDSDPGIKSGRDSGAVVVALRNISEQKLTTLKHHNIIPIDLVG